jgi:hypothetical protein
MYCSLFIGYLFVVQKKILCKIYVTGIAMHDAVFGLQSCLC